MLGESFYFCSFLMKKNVFLLFNIVWPFLTMKSGRTSSIFAQTNLGLEKVQSKVIYYTRIWNGIQRIDIASPQSKTKEVSKRVNFSLQVIKMRNLIAKPLSYNDVITKIQGKTHKSINRLQLDIIVDFVFLHKTVEK